VQDYTNYAAAYADYTSAMRPPANGLAATCFSPSTVWNETERNTHQSRDPAHTPDDLGGCAPRRRILGDLRINDQLNWLYRTAACTATRNVDA